MGIYFGGVEYSGAYAGGSAISNGFASGSEVFSASPSYWAEIVRSSSSQSLTESATGNHAWLRTSDGEPLEQQWVSLGMWTDEGEDLSEPDYLSSIPGGATRRFRKPGLQWIPSRQGVSVGSIAWGGLTTHRFFSRQYPPSSTKSYSVRRTIDKAFGATLASGGGSVTPDTFMHGGVSWELWQVVPIIGANVSASGVGDCRIQLRNRGKGRGQNLLSEMPSSIKISKETGDSANWTILPWTFYRPAASEALKFSNVGSGNSARKAVDYESDNSPWISSSAEAKISNGDTFTITMYFD